MEVTLPSVAKPRWGVAKLTLEHLNETPQTARSALIRLSIKKTSLMVQARLVIVGQHLNHLVATNWKLVTGNLYKASPRNITCEAQCSSVCQDSLHFVTKYLLDCITMQHGKVSNQNIISDIGRNCKSIVCGAMIGVFLISCSPSPNQHDSGVPATSAY